ncbi:predicted protein [Lichtheimia corymbifera JMRC:FSU:9682]|uniref:Uncharacterized protein n=1 Tax=Lichtheimia corymbifera JMRC:FSU:9682 TaxID=1263082 RepID=A0A068SGA1_9FUNG|nr:predicted protein [Lichtheimia corymbifera JMRC:FSU:9682]
MQLIQSEGQNIHALETRAKALADCAQSDMALRDASEIIRLAPSSSIGHSLAGWIYTLFVQHETALQCYDRALRVECDRAILEEIHVQRSYNARQLLKRIDFITNLPFQLLPFILPPTLKISSIVHLCYLHVCSTWRQRVLQCTQLHWLQPKILSSHAIWLLQAYAPYLDHLRLRCPVFYSLGVRPDTRFTALQSLNITCTCEPDPIHEPILTFADYIMHSNFYISALFTLFQSIGQTLKELRLWFNVRIRGQWIRFDDILEHFPNLEEFFSNRNVHLAGLSQTYTNHQTMIIMSVHEPLEANEIIRLLKQLPGLRHLELSGCQNSSPLARIHQYCPSLRALAYTAGEHKSMRHLDNVAINGNGLHSLRINAGINYKVHDVAVILSTYSHTLVDIRILGETTYHDHIMNLDPTTEFACLRNIHFGLRAGEQGKELLEWILKHSQNVRTVDMPRYNIDDPQVYDSMKEMRYLESLIFALPSSCLVRVLEHHASLGLQATLHTLLICSTVDDWSCALGAIAHLSTLHVLYLHLGDAALGDRFLVNMTDLFRKCVFLEDLSLTYYDELPHDIIHKFPMCLNLEFLALHAVNFLGECILDLLKCPSLISIDVPVDDYPVEIKEALSHLRGD